MTGDTIRLNNLRLMNTSLSEMKVREEGLSTGTDSEPAAALEDSAGDETGPDFSMATASLTTGSMVKDAGSLHVQQGPL